MLPPSLLVLSQGWGLIDLPLRASNEGSPRPRVARAQKIISLHPLLCSASKKGTWPLLPHPSKLASTPHRRGGPIGLPLRASNEGLLRPRVARAKETNGPPLLPSFPARPPSKPSEVPAEAPLPCSPILAFLNPFEGMPKVGTADPPEIRECSNACENGEPKS